MLRSTGRGWSLGDVVMHRLPLTTAVAIAALLTGCQTKPLRITSFVSGGEGAPYSLRFTQFDTVVKWRVTSCGRSTPPAGQPLGPDKEFTVKAEVTAEPTFPEDLSNRWLLDLGSLDGFMNTTDLEVTYDGGKFKSFNATVTDKTAESVTALVTAGVKVATLLAAVAAPPAGPDACADFVEAANRATATVEGRTSTLAQERTKLLALQAQGAPKAVLDRQEAAVRLAANRLEAAAADLEKALKKVTYEQKFKWPASGSAAGSERIALPPQALAQWEAQRWADPAGSIGVQLDLAALDAAGHLSPVQPENAASIHEKIAKGRLPVRVARPGALIASLKVGRGEGEVLLQKDAAIKQSGDLVYVPVEYRWPRSSAAGFGIDASGYLSSMSHKQTSAPGETIGKTVSGAAEQLQTLFPSETDKLKRENDLLTAQKTNLELKTALGPQAVNEQKLALEALQSELALKKAQLELRQTDAALKLLGPE
ncbi:MAG TPA: hypothetical protein VF495_22520 [Phenylobacterium sp.]